MSAKPLINPSPRRPRSERRRLRILFGGVVAVVLLGVGALIYVNRSDATNLPAIHPTTDIVRPSR